MNFRSSDEWERVLGRLRVLEDERAILRTLYAYGHCYDYSDHSGWVDCFVDDAVYEVFDATGEVRIVCNGRAALDTWIRGHTHPLSRWTQHLLSEPMIDINGDRASSVAYLVRTDDQNGVPYVSTTGRYHDELQRCADGKWRFVTRRARMEARTPSPPAER